MDCCHELLLGRVRRIFSDAETIIPRLPGRGDARVKVLATRPPLQLSPSLGTGIRGKGRGSEVASSFLPGSSARRDGSVFRNLFWFRFKVGVGSMTGDGHGYLDRGRVKPPCKPLFLTLTSRLPKRNGSEGHGVVDGAERLGGRPGLAPATPLARFKTDHGADSVRESPRNQILMVMPS